MITEITKNREVVRVRGWIVYDARCSLCLALIRPVRRLFASRGFRWLPLQTPGSAAFLGIHDSAFDTRMHVRTCSGRLYDNADALGVLCRSVWWLWPLGALLLVPPFRELGRLSYDWLARNRHCFPWRHQPLANETPSIACELKHAQPAGNARRWERRDLAGEKGTLPPRVAMIWLPAILLTTLTAILTHDTPSWLRMWLLVFAIFAGCKWATYRDALQCGLKPRWPRIAAYLFAWPGMDAHVFLNLGITPRRPQAGSAAIPADETDSMANLICGALLVWGLVPHLLPIRPLLAGWLGMIGIVLILHFGLFALLASLWQRVGLAATPLMRSPIASKSLSEFWGVRWNTAFHELAHRYLFRPVLRRAGTRGALMTVFLASGLVHDLVISVPARAGYGLPTLYFIIQGIGVLFERTAVARKLGLDRGLVGWLFTLLITAAPLGLMLHPAFVHEVVLPFLRVLRAWEPE